MRHAALWVRAGAALSPVRAPRSGLTLTEVLVVVFILGILAALLLPAIQRARATARRTQCASRLRTLELVVAPQSVERTPRPCAGSS